MHSIRFLILRLIVVTVLVLGMATSGFAHRFVDQDLDSALVDFVQAGGSLGDLCGDVRGRSRHSAQSCEACRLVGAAVVPLLEPACSTPFGRSTETLTAAFADIQTSTCLDPSRPVRAPPTI